MKLYTEDQVRVAMSISFLNDYDIATNKQIIESLKSIELPSDEDNQMFKIVEQEYKRHNNNDFLYGNSEELQLAYKAGVWDGVKWVIEQIKQQSDER